jgi:hypothetical protein
MSRTSIKLCIALAAFLLAGCASKYSGFLDSSIYPKLKPGENEGSEIWLKDGADLRTYHYLLIDPVQCVAPKSKLTPEQEKKATDAFRRILVEEVDPFYPVVDKPGPNVLRVRIALTELTPDKGDMGVGAAALEVDFRDSRTDEVLCAAVSRIEGSEKGKGEAKDEWKAVEGAFYEWADRLIGFMDSYQE